MRHLDNKVGKIFLLLLIRIKWTFNVGSSSIFNKAFIELVFKNSILSIKTNLGFSLKDDLLSADITSLIWLISIIFLSKVTSIIVKLGFDLFKTVLKELLSGLIWNVLIL